jgi:hypothetical protein
MSRPFPAFWPHLTYFPTVAGTERELKLCYGLLADVQTSTALANFLMTMTLFLDSCRGQKLLDGVVGSPRLRNSSDMDSPLRRLPGEGSLGMEGCRSVRYEPQFLAIRHSHLPTLSYSEHLMRANIEADTSQSRQWSWSISRSSPLHCLSDFRLMILSFR